MAEVTKLNLTNIRKTADLERDLRLQSGDMIYVPRDKIAKIERYVRIINTGVYFNPPSGPSIMRATEVGVRLVVAEVPLVSL